MAGIGNATALAALDAIVVDTETTGLDAAKAWIVEIAAVRIAGGRLDPPPLFRNLINPGEPVPKAAIAVHGIDDAAVAGAPRFHAVASNVAAALAAPVLIGHSLGFDLAVLKREFARANVAWQPPPTLDTRLLAEVAAPGLAGYSLEGLSAWLGVPMAQRHSAVGDAETTARIFLALIPKLRDAGIRTLAEAQRACRGRSATLETQHRAGWAEPVPPDGRAAPVPRIDSYPYRHRIADVMSAPARFTPPDAPLAGVLQRMMDERVSSLFVHPDGSGRPVRADETGIVTERDVLRALAGAGAAALDKRASDIASRPLVTVAADSFCYLGVARMNRHGLRHLGVTDTAGYVIGAVSARDMLRLRAEGAVALGDEIQAANNVAGLARAWSQLPRTVAALLADGVSGRQVAAIVSRRLCALSARAAVLAERRMREAGEGGPPCAYAFAVLGSAGRGESLLAMDQDNALVFAEGAPDGPQDRWFAQLGTHAADILDEAGVPYCKGGVMAKNPQWRGSVATWQGRIAHWIGRSHPDDLLAVDIFFDMLGVHGDTALIDTIWRDAFDAARGQAAFAKLLVDAAGPVAPGFTLFRRFRTEQGRIDLKKSGLFGIVSAARALAICHHVVERATPARLEGVKMLGIGGEDIDGLLEAQDTFLDLIAAQQVADVEQGVPPSNVVAVRRLSRRHRERLTFALHAVENLDEMTRDLLFRD
ncbi:MAG: CBS domain-containing protein [Xanthobacteraceae bacterium]|nr:CBS domain-containing protein [Xanthobacteraceae bacterium]